MLGYAEDCMMWVLFAIVGVLACSQGGECNWLKQNFGSWVPSNVLNQENYIVNGSESPPHAFNYQASLVIERDSGSVRCGGSLIAPQWVLTAAHCIQRFTGPKFLSAEVLLGAHNRYEEEPNQQRINSKEVYIYPGWLEPSRRAMIDDVALIKLEKPAKLNSYVNTVRLPNDDEKEMTFDNYPVRVAGWGVTETGQSTDKLRFYETEVVPKEKCKAEAGMIEQHICTTGYEYKSLGSGDSGGAMIAYGRDGKPLQIGIVSFGVGPGWPEGYARVTYYLDWIRDTMKQHS